MNGSSLQRSYVPVASIPFGQVATPAPPGATHAFDAGVFIAGTLFNCQGDNCVPTPSDGTSWQMTGETLPFGSFNATLNAGQWLPVQANAVNPLIFASCRSGTEVVTGSCNGQQAPPDNIVIRKPTAQPADYICDQVAVVQENGHTFIRAGRPGMVGIEIGFEAESTDGSSGHLAAIQLVGTTRTLKQNDGKLLVLTTGNHQVLDIAQNQQSYLYLDRQVQVGYPLQISDSPAQEVDDNFSQFTVSENFLTTLMFRSDTSADAAWVAVQSLVWGWDAVANRTGPGTWVLDQGECVIQCYGTFVPAYLLPSWDSNIRQYQWQAGAAPPSPLPWPYVGQVTDKSA